MKAHIVISNYRGFARSPLQEIWAAIERLRATPGFEIHEMPPAIYGSAFLDGARNEQVSNFLKRTDADRLVMIDDDMLPEPKALVKLLSHDAPVVSAVCTTRQKPVKLVAKLWHPQDRMFYQLDWVNLSRPTAGPYAPGAAFIAIKREALEAITEQFLQARDWLEDHRPVFDRMRVRAEHRETERARKEVIRRKDWERDGKLVLFSFQHREEEQHAGEDIMFALRLLQAGIPITMDPTIRVRHLGELGVDHSMYVPENTEEEVAMAIRGGFAA